MYRNLGCDVHISYTHAPVCIQVQWEDQFTWDGFNDRALAKALASPRRGRFVTVLLLTDVHDPHAEQLPKRGSKCQFLKERSFSEKWKSLICVVCPSTTARSHTKKKKKAIENGKNQNLKVTMEKYVIDQDKLIICRTYFDETQTGDCWVCRDQTDSSQPCCLAEAHSQVTPSQPCWAQVQKRGWGPGPALTKIDFISCAHRCISLWISCPALRLCITCACEYIHTD